MKWSESQSLVRNLILLLATCSIWQVNADEVDTLASLNSEIVRRLESELADVPKISDEMPDAVDLYSRRGDLYFFLGNFSKAESDYQQMVHLRPELDTSHWRLGIAGYYANHPDQAAAQFDKYHVFDNVDRENGIWRYLSHRKAFGKGKAQEQLLKYQKDDRPPFREVYKLFDNTITPAQLLASIPETLPAQSRDSQLFYAHLYIGLNYAAEGERQLALQSLRTATLNTWPEKAGYGPRYMWHVGRVQYNLLNADKPQQR